jgi:hypothetical protein
MEEREFSLQGRRLAVIGSCVFCRNGHNSCDCNFMHAHSNGGYRQHELLYWLQTLLDINWIDKSLFFVSYGVVTCHCVMLQIFRTVVHIIWRYSLCPRYSVSCVTWYCAFCLVWKRLILEEYAAFSPPESSLFRSVRRWHFPDIPGC